MLRGARLVFTTTTTIMTAELHNIEPSIPIFGGTDWVFSIQPQPRFSAVAAGPGSLMPQLKMNWLVLSNYLSLHGRSLEISIDSRFRILVVKFWVVRFEERQVWGEDEAHS